jgi:hypothetical protein
LIKDPLREPIYYSGLNIDVHHILLNTKPNCPTLPFSVKYSGSQIDKDRYVVEWDEYIYRPRFSILVFMLFMPKVIGLVGLIKEFLDLVINLNLTTPIANSQPPHPG